MSFPELCMYFSATMGAVFLWFWVRDKLAVQSPREVPSCAKCGMSTFPMTKLPGGVWLCPEHTESPKIEQSVDN